MIQGKNSELVFDGLRYHIQTEYIDTEEGLLLSQVFLKGQVVYQKKEDVVEKTKGQLNTLHDMVISDIKEMML